MRSYEAFSIGDIAREIDGAAHDIESAARILGRISYSSPDIAGQLGSEVRHKAYEHERLVRAFNTYTTGGLGLPIIIPVAIGGGMLISALAAWAFKHHSETKEIERRAELYDKMIEQGVNPDVAAQRATGQYSSVAEALSKAAIIVAILAGVYIVVKLK